MTVTYTPATALTAEEKDFVIKIGEARYEIATRTLLVEGAETTLEPRIGDLLVCLAQARGPVTRDALLNPIWGDAGSDEALTQAVSKLRRALNDMSRPHQIIQTVPKTGYRLGVNTTIDAAFAGDGATGSTNSTFGAVARHARKNSRYLAGVATGVGLSHCRRRSLHTGKPAPAVRN